MAVDKKILEEIRRYKSITRYINEQGTLPPEPEAPAPGAPAPGAPAPGAAPGAPAPGSSPGAPGTIPPPPNEPNTEGNTNVNLETDDEVEEVGPDGQPINKENKDDKDEKENNDEEIEELDITDLIDTQKNMSEKQEEYFENLFNQLDELKNKLGEMDLLVKKIDNLDFKFEKYKPKTPEEKLELRSLDSGPFKQKLSDFFDDKKVEMEKSGKNEYVLTSDDVENYSPSEIQKSFDDGIEPFDPEIYYK